MNINSVRLCVLALTGAAVLLFTAPTGVLAAQAPAADIPAAPRFDITRFAVEGNTLLKADQLERTVAPYVGKQKDFSDIQRALEALEQAYRDLGYGVVQVLLPEQDITRGVVQFRVIEPRIGKVTVEDNKHFDTQNVLASLPGLKPGATPNSSRIARNLQLLAEHPAKQTTVLLKSGATEGEIDATVKIADERPLKFAITLDNSGTDDTGKFRTGFGMQHSNLFNRDHVLNLQYVTNPENPSKVKIYGAGYRIPFYELNSTLDMFAGYSDVDSGTLAGLFSVSGSGTIYGARYTLHLAKIDEYEHRVVFGLDYRAFKNEVLFQGQGQVPDITIHPVSVGYNGLWRMSAAELGFYANLSHNFGGGNDGGGSDFRNSRAGATAHYNILRYGAHYARVLPEDWQLRWVWNAQYTEDALVSGEQFGFGGPDSVRGFNIREVADDSGYSTSLELYTPELTSKFGWKWGEFKARALAFYDRGNVERNNALPGEPYSRAGSSFGVGLRLGSGRAVSVRLDFAQVLEAAGLQGRNDQMFNASVALGF